MELEGSHKKRPSLNTTDHPNWKSEALAWRVWAVTQEEELQKISDGIAKLGWEKYLLNGAQALAKALLGKEEGGGDVRVE